MLSRTNEALLRDLLGEDLIDLYLPRRAATMLGTIRGHIDGVHPDAIGRLLDRIATARIDTVFLDGSNLGAAAAAIKATAPSVRIVTFFHNVEARFFWGSLKARQTLRACAVLLANFVAERKAVRASDVLICLSERDSGQLERLYGRRADVVMPIVLTDTLPTKALGRMLTGKRFALFVGGSFYANVDGIRWFARHVAPHTTLHTVVVGRGMEALADEFADNPAIMFAGAVDDLASWYRDAYVVIAPIFDGSGMKTKLAEALMHGKHVIGTPESFSGYDPAVLASGWTCTSAAQFLTATTDATAMDLPAYDPAMRTLYERFHSVEVGRARLADALAVVAPANRS